MMYEFLAIWFFIVCLSCSSLTLLYIVPKKHINPKTTNTEATERSVLQPKVASANKELVKVY